MKTAIYLVANDAVFDQAVALVKSIRRFDPQVPVLLIPYDRRMERTADILSGELGVQLFPDLHLLEDLDRMTARTLRRHRLKHPQRLRSLASWFGPAERFLYIDADVVVFQRVADVLSLLDEADFICCDFQFKTGLRHVFTEKIRGVGLFSESDLGDVFNGGFWGSSRSALDWDALTARLERCGDLRRLLDFSGGACAQPILNYLVLSQLPRRVNLAKSGQEPGNWAGSAHFRQVGDVLFDGERPLRYLHWAGQAIQPGGPYWSIWKHYRDLEIERC